MTKRRKRRTARGTLAVIALLLIGSALIRVSLGAGSALALVGEGRGETLQSDTAKGAACEPPADIATVLAALKDRETRIAQREAQVQDRLRALAVAEEEITAKMQELVAAENALRETIALADSAAEDDISRLVAVYEAMKPKDAAALFETMDPEFAAGFLGRMQPASAAGIMAGLSPQTAYSVSAILAGRNASVPTE